MSNIQSNIRLFADDTSLFLIIDRDSEVISSANTLNQDITTVMEWAERWLVTFNSVKTESLLISRKRNSPIHPALSMSGQNIQSVPSHKHLGVFLSSDCSWHSHVDFIKEKAWSRVNVMRKLKFQIDRKSLETIFTCFIRPLLEYGDVIWDNCTLYEKNELDKIQNEAARIVTGATKLVSLQQLNNDIGWESLETRRVKHKLILFYKMVNHLSPTYLSSLVPPMNSEVSNYSLRNADDFQVPLSRTSLYSTSFLPSTTREWNSIPSEFRNSDSLLQFKRYLNRNNVIIPTYYYKGLRKAQVMHTRLRTNCSALNHHLFSKNIVDSPLCSCGSIENNYHYLFNCQKYTEIRY